MGDDPLPRNPSAANGVSEVERCLACGAEGTGRYCPACGRPLRTRLPGFRELLAEVSADFAGLERRLFRTLVAVLARPGFLTQEYRSGRGARYLSPARVYLLSSAAYFAIYIAGGGDARVSLGLFAMGGPAAEVVPPEVVVFLSIPLLALFFRLVYGRGRTPYTEGLSFALVFQSAVFLFSLAAALIPLEAARSLLKLAYALTYLVLGGRRLWEPSAPTAVLKAFLILVCNAVTLLVALLTAGFVASLLS